MQRGLVNFFLDEAMKAGYEEIVPPYLVNAESGFGTGQLPDKEGQMYHAQVDDLYLIPTAEVPVTNLYRDVILKEEQLPIKNVAYSPCFRREAGSWGAHVRGLNRLHQFEKVEQFVICEGDLEKSKIIQEEMIKIKPRNLESITKKLFIDSGKVLFQPHPSDEEIKKGENFYNRNVHYTLFYNPVDFTLNIFFKSFKNVEEEIVIIINKESVVTIDAKPNHWNIRPLGIFDNINHVRIDNSEKVIYEKTFDDEIRKIFKIESCITNEKDN
jgi:hypothetical protein